ncbi:hypothetical protein BDQ12DRAFT_344067 [Crucibulum laeve]|uniref:Copper transporter n=1 Tax=Crucibulum laeve TaxID=68775 RepID=A0A5C3MDD8_9AGAR|nr:hypothetical protein BDQ12DRAFT_344067 [Crucibulum laeve]
MEKWESHLHWTYNNEHVLLSAVRLSSFPSFLAAAFLVIFVCLTERLASHALNCQLGPRFIQRSRWSWALWRSGLYWVVTFLRLCYMLAAMTFHLGLLLIIVTTLSVSQLVVELRSSSEKSSMQNPGDYSTEPLLQERSYPMRSVGSRARSKSKPDEIFIHPTQSNIARADAAALELGLAGETDLVKGNFQSRGDAWETGKGRDMARQLLASTEKKSKRHSFRVSSDSDSDCHSSEL